jgi:hypothetical protein
LHIVARGEQAQLVHDHFLNVGTIEQSLWA